MSGVLNTHPAGHSARHRLGDAIRRGMLAFVLATLPALSALGQGADGAANVAPSRSLDDSATVSRSPPAASPAAAPQSTARYDAESCIFSGRDWFDPARMRCGTLIVDVPGFAPGFRVPVLRIAGPAAAAGKPPVVFFNGGPGGRSIMEVSDWLAHPLLGERDLILFDARGTGRSEPVLCAGLGAHVMTAIAADLDRTTEARMRGEAVEHCLRETGLLGLGAISTAAMAADVEAIRQAFGDEKLVLYGVSYGTRGALAYASAHPGRVASIVLDSPVPPASDYYADIPTTFDAALSALFEACRTDAACDARYPGLADRHAQLLERLRATPLRVELPATHARPAVALTLNARDLRLLLHQAMYGRELLPVIPAWIDQIERGRIETLPLWFELCLEMRVEQLGFAAYYLTLAAEETAVGAGEGDLAFFDADLPLLARLRAMQATSTVSPGISIDLGTVKAPVLLLSGRYDPIASPTYARDIAAALPGARLLSFPDVGHAVGVSVPSAGAAMVTFVRDPAAVAADDPSGGARRPAFATDQVESDYVARLLQKVMLPRSLMPLAPLGYAVAAYLLLAVILLASCGLRLLRRLRGKPRNHPWPVSGMSMLAVLAGLLVLGLWAGMMAVAVTGPAPAVLLIGIPAGWVWPLRIAAMAFMFTTLWQMASAPREWRNRTRRHRIVWVLALSANVALLYMLFANGLAWP